MPDKVKTKAAWGNESNSLKGGNMMSEEKAVMPRLDGMRKRKNQAMPTPLVLFGSCRKGGATHDFEWREEA